MTAMPRMKSMRGSRVNDLVRCQRSGESNSERVGVSRPELGVVVWLSAQALGGARRDGGGVERELGGGGGAGVEETLAARTTEHLEVGGLACVLDAFGGHG